MDDRPIRLYNIQPHDLVKRHAPGPGRIAIPTKSEVTAHANPSASAMSESSTLIKQREGHVAQPQASADRSDAGGVVNGDILEAPEVNYHGPVLPAGAC